MNPARLKAYMALAAAALIWGAAQPLVKPALEFVSPLQYMYLRYLVALPLGVFVLVVSLKKYKPSKQALIKIMIIEIVSIVNLWILYTGLKHTTALQSSLILDARPIFITLMGIWLLKEREEKHEWLGLLLSVVGICMVIIGPYTNKVEVAGFSMRGNLLIVLTNIIAAAHTLFIKKVYKDIPKPFIASINTIYGLIFFTFIILGNTGSLPLQALSITQVLVPVLYMGLLGTLVAQSLSTYGFSTIEASEAVLFHYLEPLVYIPLAIFWLKEPLQLFQIIGLIIIMTGVAIAAARFPKHRHSALPYHANPLLKHIRIAHASAKTSPHLLN